MKFLAKKESQIESTLGLDIVENEWTISCTDEIRGNSVMQVDSWDFPGNVCVQCTCFYYNISQPVHFGMFENFITSRSIFVIVFDATTPMQSVEPWLNFLNYKTNLHECPISML